VYNGESSSVSSPEGEESTLYPSPSGEVR